jgi:DNA-directed RNA polymerases I, II, and III subunit RPABC1
MQFSARPSEFMIQKFTPPATPANPNPSTEAGTIWVEFCPEKSSIGISVMKKFVSHCTANNFKAGILVTSMPLSAQARKVISVTQQYTQVECFLEEDLLVNITHHDLVPKHVLLSREEKTALLKRYRLKETQLPRILSKDPIARYFGLKRGQVVKIIRTSETAGRYASYRLCV